MAIQQVFKMAAILLVEVGREAGPVGTECVIQHKGSKEKWFTRPGSEIMPVSCAEDTSVWATCPFQSKPRIPQRPCHKRRGSALKSHCLETLGELSLTSFSLHPFQLRNTQKCSLFHFLKREKAYHWGIRSVHLRMDNVHSWEFWKWKHVFKHKQKNPNLQERKPKLSN